VSRILIVNGNPQDLIAQGRPDYAQSFLRVFRSLDPSLSLFVINPNHSPMTAVDLDGVTGVVFTGSSTTYAADTPQAAPHRTAMETVFARGLPVWGSCNGLHLAAVVLGGRVGVSPNGIEIGLGQDLTVTADGAGHAMMSGRGPVFTACTIHRDEVQMLPPGGCLMATNGHSPVQAFAVATGGVDFWGTQYHPEVAPALIASELRHSGGDARLAEDIEAAVTHAPSAARLGTTSAALAVRTHATELRNWLLHVQGFASASAISALPSGPCQTG
jgi:GMP synthase (glutamine-hydrolysing)